MKMQLTSICALAVAVALASPPAAATQAASAGARTTRTSPSLFEIADVNHDGALTHSEVPPAWSDLRAHFDAQDWDHNHRLSRAEFNHYLIVLVGINRDTFPHQRLNPATQLGDRTSTQPARHSRN